MNKDVWYRMFKQWVDASKAIVVLSDSHLIDDEEEQKLSGRLLLDIIETIAGEIEDEQV